MINKNKLRGLAITRGYSWAKMATRIGITPETLSRNVSKGTLGIDHIAKIQKLLYLSDEEVIEVFLRG